MMSAVSLLRQEQPRLRHVDQRHPILRIGQAFRDLQAPHRAATVLMY